MSRSNPTTLRISYVAFQPHLVITHPLVLGQCLIFRIPEFVTNPLTKSVIQPGHVVWQEIERETRLVYRWDAPEETRLASETDFRGEAEAGDGHVTFQVTMKRLGTHTHAGGVHLFCLQAGGAGQFHDYEGTRTFIRHGDRWRSVNDMINGQFASHRMCGFTCTENACGPGQTSAGIMCKTSNDGDWVLGVALDECQSLSCNHQIWPSCIHANPRWHELAPGEEQTVHGRVYYLRGTLDDLMAAYAKDFGPEQPSV